MRKTLCRTYPLNYGKREKIDPSQNFGMYTMMIARNLIYDTFRRKLVSDGSRQSREGWA